MKGAVSRWDSEKWRSWVGRWLLRLFLAAALTGACECSAGVVDGQAAPFVVIHRGDDEGMPPGQVFAIRQTHDGYLWFGADGGLARFDGARFKVFDSRNSPVMKSSRVGALYEDRNGTLWIGCTGTGLIRMQGTNMAAYGRMEGLQNVEVSAIREDAQGKLWVGTDGGGLYWFENGGFHSFKAGDGLTDLFVHSLSTNADGALWVGYRAGARVIRAGQLLRTWRCDALGLSNLTSLACDPDGSVWMGSREGIFHFKDANLVRITPQGQVTVADKIQVAATGEVWAGSGGGLVRIHHGKTTVYTTADGFSGNLVTALLVDREGSVWYGNNAGGVDQMKSVRFATYGTSQGVLHPMVTCLFQDGRDNIWIGSERGVTRFGREGFTQYSTNNGLSHRLVFTVCEDKEGDIWIGTRRGLNRIGRDGRLQTFDRPNRVRESLYWCSYRDRSGALWFGAKEGLLRVKDNQYRFFTHDTDGLSHDDVRAVCEDASGALWVGTSYSLNRLEGDRFRVFKEASPGHQFKVVIALLPDPDGSLWIGTLDKGLFRHRDGKFDHFTTKQGLFDDGIYGIVDDGRGRLWMSCIRGVFSVEKQELDAVAAGRMPAMSCLSYGKADGMLSTECNGTFQPAALRSRDGRLWFSTSKGAAVIQPNLAQEPMPPPSAVLEEVLVDGTHHQTADPVVVPPGGQRVEIHFTAPTFRMPGQVSFRYRLEGFDHDWTTNADSRIAQYTRLPPGPYEFQVTAAQRGGDWNPAAATLAFQVRPLVYQTAWFRLLAVVAIIGTTVLAARAWSARKLQRELQGIERRHALERERARIAQDMHDGLGSNLVKISLLGEIAENDVGNPESARVHIRRMAETARETVREMDEIVWAVNPKNDTVENFANYLSAFAREHFELTPTRLNLELPAEFPEAPLAADLRHNLFLAAKEALNNIVRHARATQAWLRIEMQENQLVLTIRDDGCGLPENHAAGAGQDGLLNIRSRLERIGGVVEHRREPSGGTRIVLRKSLGPD